ncbi:Transcription initiation factor TFIID subunit 10 [Chytridiales sp. JEL 0842]|nr:Transcription initiation factor TFIID subunit 10 [Chytridiales sp. JEL 0842]
MDDNNTELILPTSSANSSWESMNQEPQDFDNSSNYNRINDDENQEEGDEDATAEAQQEPERPTKKRKKTRKEKDDEKKEIGLGQVLTMMEDYVPVIPDSVTDYYLARSGFECSDQRVKRLLALAAQKLVSDIARDAFQYSKIRQQAMQGKDKKMLGVGSGGASGGSSGASKKNVLTIDDLSGALQEYGINVKRPEYFA